MRTQLWTIPTIAFAMLLTGGCATFLAPSSTKAVEMTVDQARFDLECSDVEATVLSAEGSNYTIAASGCGRQATYSTSCPDGGACTASAQPGQLKQVDKEMR